MYLPRSAQRLHALLLYSVLFVLGCAAPEGRPEPAASDGAIDGSANVDDTSPTEDASYGGDTPVTPAAVCGNGTVETGEECDDGDNDDPLCDENCRLVRPDPVEMGVAPSEGILVPNSACRPRSFREGYRARPAVAVRYRVQQCVLDNGTPAVPLSQIRQALADIAPNLAAAGIRLVEESVVQFRQANCVVAFSDAAFTAARIGATPREVVPLVFVDRITSSGAFTVGGFASFGGLVVSAGAVPQIVRHELGHYFGLAHTFSCRNGVETSVNCDSTGDFICDTPPDRGPINVNGIDRCDDGSTLNGSCTNDRCMSATCTDGARPMVDNAMSYYNCSASRFTPEQLDYMRCAVENDLRRLIEAPCADECARDGVVECVDGSVRRRCGNFDSDTCLEWGPHSACGNTERCGGGDCIPGCAEGARCDTGDPCGLGVIACVAGTGRCQRSGHAPRGTACGGGRVCDGSGGCACPAGTIACDGTCRAPGRCGGCLDPVEQCNGRDDDCDGLIDEGLSGCGLAVTCRDFSFGTNRGTGSIEVPVPSGSTAIPLIEVRSHVTNGEDDGAYRFDHARVGNSVRFTWTTDYGNPNDRVSGSVCVLGLGTAVGGAAALDLRVNNGETDRVFNAGGSVSPWAAQEVTLSSARSVWSAGDDDMEWWSTPGNRSARFTVANGNSGGYIEGDVVWLSLPRGYRVIRAPFRAANEQTATVNLTINPAAGRRFVFIDITGFRTGGDDDASYSSGCSLASTTVSCSARVWGGNSGSALEGAAVLIEGPR